MLEPIPHLWSHTNAPSVLLLDPHNEHTVEITDVASLPDIRDDVDVTLARHLLESVAICRDLQVNVETPRVGPAFCFHDWCYLSLIWGVRCHPPKSVVYKLVRTFIPSSSRWENICEARYQLDPRGSLQTLIAHADQPPFTFQPLFMYRLERNIILHRKLITNANKEKLDIYVKDFAAAKSRAKNSPAIDPLAKSLLDMRKLRRLLTMLGSSTAMYYPRSSSRTIGSFRTTTNPFMRSRSFSCHQNSWNQILTSKFCYTLCSFWTLTYILVTLLFCISRRTLEHRD
jgi:hypothetical protein